MTSGHLCCLGTGPGMVPTMSVNTPFLTLKGFEFQTEEGAVAPVSGEGRGGRLGDKAWAPPRPGHRLSLEAHAPA